jgi:RNA polymerase sigma-70 factor (ECF subfamily)
MTKREHVEAGDPDHSGLAEIIRQEWPRIVATLVGDLGDLAEAEDAVQEATLEAMRAWPERGVPDRPGAWLTTVARRRAIDRLRRAETGRSKAELAARHHERHEPNSDEALDLTDDMLNNASMLRDEQLRLLFACCHPSLRPEAQMALTLRSIGGLTTTEIARAFVQPEATVAQRLVRAKKKIAGAAIPFRIPPDHELLSRTNLVRRIVYLIFNEGYNATSGDEIMRADLCLEAIRLAELLAELTPDDAESLGLVALLHLIHARANARTDDVGNAVLLRNQDRKRWDRDRIERGAAVLDRAIKLERPGPFQFQAAIQAVHADADSADTTDWLQIELLYARLIAIEPTPVGRLNHAVAVSMSREPQAGLALLAADDLAKALVRYPHYHSARAELLRGLDPTAAAAAYDQALACTESEPERRFLQRRLDELI